MTMAVTDGRRATGAKAVLCASTGNTSASAAAYAARAGITCAVLIPQGKIAMGKLAQALDARRQDACRSTATSTTASSWPASSPTTTRVSLVNSVNPVPHRGPEDRGVRDRRRARRRPGHPLPAGRQRRQHHRLLEGLHRVPPRRRRPTGCPRMLGFQAAGAAPLVLGEPVGHPETIATAIRIGNPASWDSAVAAREESGGRHRHGHRRRRSWPPTALVARDEGVFVEPASAASVAGLLRPRRGRLGRRRARRWCAPSPATA